MTMKRFYCYGVMALLWVAVAAETVEKIPFGDMEQWVTRNIEESRVIGGKTKQVYAIAPTKTITGDAAYRNMGGSPWGSSNVMAKVMGVTKCSNAVFPDVRAGGGRCCKMSTILEECKVLGLINMEVLVSGSIFLGEMQEPIRSSKSPYSKMEMGVAFTRRPKALQFDYRVDVPAEDSRIYSSGFGSKKMLAGRDNAEVYIILQRRWEDKDGRIYAKRVGTGRERYSRSTSGWVNGHRIAVMYGDIRGRAEYRDYMGLLSGERAYYARNSKGKMVPVEEVGWDDATATPTHMLVMASSGCGTAFVGTVGMTLWVDNMALVY